MPALNACLTMRIGLRGFVFELDRHRAEQPGRGFGAGREPRMTWCNISIHNAVATSAALGFPIAVANVLGYVVSGQSVQGLPAGAFGYIWLPALVVIAACPAT